MSDEIDQQMDEDTKADKKCKQENGKAKENFEAVLACIAEEAYNVNKARILFLTGKSATPEKLRAAEKNLFNAIKVASKVKKKGQFESLVVELKYKEQEYTDPTTGMLPKT